MTLLGFIFIVSGASVGWALADLVLYRKHRARRERAFQQMFEQVLTAAAPMVKIGLSGQYWCADCGGPHNADCSPHITEHLLGCKGLIRYQHVNAVLSQFEEDLTK